jgi:hypothetical protein
MDSGDKYYLNSSLTMQKALETAYDDWNKNKIQNNEIYESDEIVVTPKNDEAAFMMSHHMNYEHQKPLETHHNVMASTITEEASDNEIEMTQDVHTKSNKSKQSSASPPPTTTAVPYYFGNPNVDLVRGIIHIYKDR